MDKLTGAGKGDDISVSGIATAKLPMFLQLTPILTLVQGILTELGGLTHTGKDLKAGGNYLGGRGSVCQRRG